MTENPFDPQNLPTADDLLEERKIARGMINGWALFGNDLTAHFVTHSYTDYAVFLVAACGARQRAYRSEEIIAPLFRCQDCLTAQNIPTEPRPERF